MKQFLIKSLAVMAIFGMTFVSCKDDDTGKHVYTEEELAEIARQDSLRNLIPADYVYSYNITIPISRGYDGATVTIDSTKILELFDYKTVAELCAALGTIADGAQTGNDITFFGYNYSTKAINTAKGPSNTNYFGHWFNAAGDIVDWGDDGSTLFCEKKDTFSLDFTVGFRPGRPAVDSVYHIVEGMKMGDVTIAFLFNVKVGPEEVVQAELVGTQNISLSAPQDANYKAFPQTLNIAGMTTALGAAPTMEMLYGVNADNSIYTSGKTATLGYWYNATGNVCN